MTSSPCTWPAPTDPADPFARPTADPLGPPVALGPERRVPTPCAGVLTDEDLVRIATDHDPAAVPVALDLVLGPLAEEADHASAVAAVAFMAAFPTDHGGDPPLGRWADHAPRSSRAPARAITRAPPAPWRITGIRAGTVDVEDLLGLDAFAPEGPVVLDRCGAPLGPPEVGGWLLARIVRTTTGWHAVGALAAPAADPEQLRVCLARAAAAAVADGHPVVSAVDALCARGYDVARWTFEQGWRRRS